ncbi:MAG: hypothetical protein KIS96_00340 [Bauldia sp.]|nr:hypothetical protein [Bauldia sp.]
MRRTIGLSLLIVVVIGGWLIIDADSRARDEIARVWNDLTAFLSGGEREVPNWGDVAAKVGEFADEERALREVLDPALVRAEPAVEEKPTPEVENEAEPEVEEASPAADAPRG